MRRIGEHAVVLGAGVAGLLAARVLSDAYQRVTVIERDALGSAAAPRRGVPQGGHAHLLIPSGTRILYELFDGLSDQFSAAGVPAIRDFAEFVFAPGGARPILLTGPTEDPFICLASRPFLEQQVRARVEALPGVDVIGAREAVDLVADATSGRVTGVRTRRRDTSRDTGRDTSRDTSRDTGRDTSRDTSRDTRRDEQTFEADLVLDATGRGSRAPTWLAALGYEPPAEDQLTVNLAYVTQQFRLRPGALDAKMVAIGATPARPSGFILLAQEDDTWILTVFGYEGAGPPADRDGVLDVVRKLATADVYDAVRAAEPIGDTVAYRFVSNRRRRYDQLRRLPAGFAVIGDAMCSTSPVYALGMSTAALQAALLREALAGGDDEWTQRFIRAAAGRANYAWQAAFGGDLSVPQVKGPRPLPVRLIGRYSARVARAAERDSEVATQLLRVASLQDSPSRMFRPAFAARVLWRSLGTDVRQAEPSTVER